MYLGRSTLPTQQHHVDVQIDSYDHIQYLFFSLVEVSYYMYLLAQSETVFLLCRQCLLIVMKVLPFTWELLPIPLAVPSIFLLQYNVST